MSTISLTTRTEVGARAAIDGPRAWLAGSAVALAVTAAAVALPGLARHDDHLFRWSGVAMVVADAFVLAGTVALARSGAVRRTWWTTAALVAAVAGSAGIVVAEALLRIDDTLGNRVFGVVGPMQAVGFIVAGAALALGAGTWHGWHRFPLLALGLYIPLVLVPLVVAPSQAAGKEENLLPLAGYHVLVGLVGLAFDRERRRTA